MRQLLCQWDAAKGGVKYDPLIKKTDTNTTNELNGGVKQVKAGSIMDNQNMLANAKEVRITTNNPNVIAAARDFC